jgi:hypothetical protein
MKALSLTQPWASLVALGEKKVETRSWSTRYRGPIAIHASMGFTRDDKSYCYLPPFSTVLAGHDLCPDTLPRGRVLCITAITDCMLISDGFSRMLGPTLSPNELKFGNYEPGRFAWVFGPVYRRYDPAGIYARGSLGLWDWEEPVEDESLVRQIGDKATLKGKG